jgi:hypothetical protein
VSAEFTQLCCRENARIFVPEPVLSG